MDSTLTVIALGVEIVVLLIGAVWAVAKINSTTSVLNANVKALTRSVDKLEQAIDHMERRLGEHEVRVSLLERGSQ